MGYPKGRSGSFSLWSATGLETLWPIYLDCEILPDLVYFVVDKYYNLSMELTV